MSLDLRLLPFDYDGGDFAYSQTVLSLDRDDEFVRGMLDIPGMKVPEKFNSFVGRSDNYDDACYGLTIKTPYGDPLEWIEVETLLNRSAELIIESKTNLAVIAYLKCLPARTKVALYWH